MRNLEDMIEQYRRELVEFSKQNPPQDAETERAVPAMADAVPVREDNAADGRRVKRYGSYEEFESKNPSSGLMRVQVTSGAGSFPIINAAVRISVPLETEDRELFSGYTDINGIVDNVRLPAPNGSYSLDEGNTAVVPYAVYTVTASHPEFAKSEFDNVPVFSGVKSIQPVSLVPLTETGREPETVNTPNQPMVLYGGEL